MQTALLTPKEIAAQLRISVSAVRTACRSGALHAIKVGRQYRVTEAAVAAWLQTQNVERKTKG